MVLSQLKKEVRTALVKNDMHAIVALARQDRRTLNVLIGSSYDKDSRESWNAVTAMGFAAKALAGTDYDFLRETARRLLWSVTDESGGIGWSAPEMLGELVCADPERFSDLVPIIASLQEEEIFRAGVLYAFLKLARLSQELVKPYRDLIVGSVFDKDPRVQAYALLTIQAAGIKEQSISGLLTEKKPVRFFDGDFRDTEIAVLVQECLSEIKGTEII